MVRFHSPTSRYNRDNSQILNKNEQSSATIQLVNSANTFKSVDFALPQVDLQLSEQFVAGTITNSFHQFLPVHFRFLSCRTYIPDLLDH
jgi:hypothetical protein